MLLDIDKYGNDIITLLGIVIDLDIDDLADGDTPKGHRCADVKTANGAGEEDNAMNPVVFEPEVTQDNDRGNDETDCAENKGADEGGVGFLTQIVRTSRFPVPRLRKFSTVASVHSRNSVWGLPEASMVRLSLSRKTELVPMA